MTALTVELRTRDETVLLNVFSAMPTPTERPLSPTAIDTATSEALASERSVARTVTPVWPSALEFAAISATSDAVEMLVARAAAPAAAPPMPAAMATATESGAVVSVVCEVAVTLNAPPFASTFEAEIRAEVVEVFSFRPSAAEKLSATAI